jgi:hypothetical protein
MKNISQNCFFEYTTKYKSYDGDEKCFCVNRYG